MQTESIKIDFAKRGGLVPVVVQNALTQTVLMLAYANLEAIEATRKTGYAHFWSTSRNALWKKGESSGYVMEVKRIEVDCDSDAVLYSVEPYGPACHLGTESCFGTVIPDECLHSKTTKTFIKGWGGHLYDSSLYQLTCSQCGKQWTDVETEYR